jgi:ribosomal protein S4
MSMATYNAGGRRSGGLMTTSGSTGYAAKQAAGGLKGMVDSYNKAYREAKQANEKRYQEMLNIMDQTTQQRAADIRSAYGKSLAGQRQQLARQGLAGSTIGATLEQGNIREQEASLNRLSDEMQKTRLGVIERRMDEYPDRAGLAQLIGGIGGTFGTGGLGHFTKLLSQMDF